MSPPEDGPPGSLVPPAFAASVAKLAGPAGVRWLERLPALVEASCERWSLTIDGASMHGVAGLVVPVRRAGGLEAVLKVSWPHEEAAPEASALRRWAGVGAVRLLAEHPASWSLLLERLDSAVTLEGLADPDGAVETAAALLSRLGVASPSDVPTVADLAGRWIEELPVEWNELGRPIRRALLDEALATCRDLGSEGPVRLLHGDFHYANVLAGEREPWLAIDPKPLAGDPAFDVGPLLRNRWSDVTSSGAVAAAVRRRFDQIVDVARLDRERARAWSIARAVDNVLWAVARSEPELAETERAVAEALSA